MFVKLKKKLLIHNLWQTVKNFYWKLVEAFCLETIFVSKLECWIQLNIYIYFFITCISKNSFYRSFYFIKT